MLSRGKRLCPGVDGRKCGAHMSPVVKDPHPTCTRCRGRNCTRDSTCISCKHWSLTQWNTFDAFNARRSHTDRKRSSNRHASDFTSLTSQSLSSSAPVKQAAPSLALPPLSTPPPSEGPGIREETKSDKPKRTRVSSSPPLLASRQEERGEDTDNELTEEGNNPPGGHLPYHLRLCSRLGLTAKLLTPTRGPTEGVR